MNKKIAVILYIVFFVVLILLSRFFDTKGINIHAMYIFIMTLLLPALFYFGKSESKQRLLYVAFIFLFILNMTLSEFLKPSVLITYIMGFIFVVIVIWRIVEWRKEKKDGK